MASTDLSPKLLWPERWIRTSSIKSAIALLLVETPAWEKPIALFPICLTSWAQTPSHGHRAKLRLPVGQLIHSWREFAHVPGHKLLASRCSAQLRPDLCLQKTEVERRLAHTSLSTNVRQTYNWESIALGNRNGNSSLPVGAFFPFAFWTC